MSTLLMEGLSGHGFCRFTARLVVGGLQLQDWQADGQADGGDAQDC